MKIMRYLILFTAIACVYCTAQKSSQPVLKSDEVSPSSVEDKTPATQKCTQHSDCVLVNAECCPCSSGGSMKAVHQSLVESHNKQIKQQCSASPNLFCPEVYLCGKWEVECVQSSCKAVKKTSS